MPTTYLDITPEEKKQLLSSFGYSDTTHDVDSNLNIVPKAQPAVANVNPTAITAKPVQSAQQFSIANTIGRNAATSVIPSGIGLAVGAGLSGLATGALEGSVVPGWGTAIGAGVGLVGGLAGAYASSKAQEKVLNSTQAGQEFNANTAIANEQNPTSAVVGNLAGSLPFLKPDLRMAKNGIQALLGGKGAREVLSNPAIQQMLVGGGIGAGQGIYDEVSNPDKPFNPTALAANVVGGAIMSPRNHALNRAVGIHPYTPEVTNIAWENGVPQITSPTILTAKPIDPAVYGGREPTPPQGRFNANGDIKWKGNVAPGYYEEIGRKLENKVDEATRPVSENDLATMEGEGGVALQVRQEVQENRHAHFNDLKSEAERSLKLDKLQADFDAMQAASLKLKNDAKWEELHARYRTTQEEQTAKKPEYDTMQVEDLQKSILNNQINQPEVPRINPQKTNTKNVEQLNKEVAQESPQDLANRKLEGKTDRYQSPEQMVEDNQTNKSSEPRQYKSELEKQLFENAGLKQVASARNAALAEKRRVSVTEHPTETIKAPSGKDVYGIADIGKRTVEQTKTRADTGFHEQAHIRYSELSDSHKARLERVINNDADAKAWMKKNNANAEEYMIQAAGEEDARRILNKDSNLSRDLTAWLRVKLGKATKEDVVRHLTNKTNFAGKYNGDIVPSVTSVVKEQPADTTQKQDVSQVGKNTQEGQRLYDEHYAKLKEHFNKGDTTSEDFKKTWKNLEDTKNSYFGGHTPEGFAKQNNSVKAQDKSQELTSSDELKRIHFLDQFHGKIEQKVEKGMRLWRESDIKVGDIFHTPKGTSIEIIGAGIHTNKNGDKLVYGKTPDGAESSFYLDKLIPTDADGKTIKTQDVEATPTDIDTSYKGFGIGNFRPLTATFDRVASVHKPLSEAFKNWETRMGQHLGLRNEAVNHLSKFDQKDVNDTLAYHRAKFRGEESTTSLNPEISQTLKDYFGEFRDQQIKAGLKINGREAGKNEWYVPDMLSDKTLDLLTRKASSPEALYALKEWARYIEKESGNKIPYETALKDVKDYVDALGSSRDNYRSINFGALRKAQGYGLPESLRETDPAKIVNKYGKRAARDLALYQELESKPEIAGILKLRDPNTGEIPPSDLSHLGADPKVKDAMKWVMNLFESSTNPKIASLVRVVNNSLLGAGTGLRDLVSVPVNALPYVSKFSDLGAFWKGMTDIRQNSIEALRSNARNNNLDKLAWNDLLDSPDRFTSTLNKTADAMRKYQGRELLEQASRIWTYGIGKELATSAIAGNNKSFLDKFGRLAKKENGEWDIQQLAKNFVDRNQGSYGGSGLPVGTMEGSFAPFLTLQKWGIEKSNVIYQDVVKPALSGENYVPLLSYTLGSILTGAGIQELNKALSNRKGQDATIAETTAIPTARNITAELATLMQLGSFAGIVGDSLKALSDTVLVGKTPRNVVSFPTATFAGELGDRTVDVAEALRQGENPWETLKSFVLDTLVSHVQNARLIANNTFNKDEANRSEKFRDLRTYKTLSGEPVPDASAAQSQNKYLNPEVSKFKQTTDLSSAAEIVPDILARFAEKAKENPMKALEFLKGVKSNSYQTVPNPENYPVEFGRYWNFLKESQGEKVAYDRIVDYFKQKGINEVKSGMIP